MGVQVLQGLVAMVKASGCRVLNRGVTRSDQRGLVLCKEKTTGDRGRGMLYGSGNEKSKKNDTAPFLVLSVFNLI